MIFEILIVNGWTRENREPPFDSNNERRVAKGCRVRWPFWVSGVPLLMENEINFGARGSAYYNPRCIYCACTASTLCTDSRRPTPVLSPFYAPCAA